MNKEEVHHHLQCITCFSASPPPVHHQLQCINCLSASPSAMHHNLQCITTYNYISAKFHFWGVREGRGGLGPFALCTKFLDHFQRPKPPLKSRAWQGEIKQNVTIHQPYILPGCAAHGKSKLGITRNIIFSLLASLTLHPARFIFHKVKLFGTVAILGSQQFFLLLFSGRFWDFVPKRWVRGGGGF